MIPEEFKVQIFTTQNQWASGLFYRLESAEDAGITLFPMPIFSHWILKTADTGIPAGLAVDACGQIYFFETDCAFSVYAAKCDGMILTHLCNGSKFGQA